MNELKIELTNGSLTRRKLGGFAQSLSGGIGYTAVSLGGAFMAGEIRAAAPVGRTGNLRDSIGYTITKVSDGFELNIGARLPKGAHVHLVEKGTQERFTKAGKSTGRMSPNPFIVPTWESRRGAFESIVAEELAIGVEAYAA